MTIPNIKEKLIFPTIFFNILSQCVYPKLDQNTSDGEGAG